MIGPRNRWFRVLTESPATPDPKVIRKLNYWGQFFLAMAVLLAGLGIYSGAWLISLRMSSRGELCLRLPQAEEQQRDNLFDNQLVLEYRHGEKLIEGLQVATPLQRQRLNVQLLRLVRGTSSLCNLMYYYTNEQAALMTLATATASVIVIVGSRQITQGIQNVNRFERTLFFATSAMLVLTVNFLQLGQQKQNINLAETSYRGHDALLQRLSSSLANLRVESGINAASSSVALINPASVALLITAIDSQLLQMPDPNLQLNASAAEQTLGGLLKNSHPTQASTPPGGAGSNQSAAERPR